MVRIAVDRGVIIVVFDAVPVDNRAVDTREFHKQYVTFQGVWIVGIIRPDQWVVMRGYCAAAIVGDGVGVEVIHRPVPTPFAADGFRRVPRHVVDHYWGGCRRQRLNVRVNEAFAAGVQRRTAEDDERQTFHLIHGRKARLKLGLPLARE